MGNYRPHALKPQRCLSVGEARGYGLGVLRRGAQPPRGESQALIYGRVQDSTDGFELYAAWRGMVRLAS